MERVSCSPQRQEKAAAGSWADFAQTLRQRDRVITYYSRRTTFWSAAGLPRGSPKLPGRRGRPWGKESAHKAPVQAALYIT